MKHILFLAAAALMLLACDLLGPTATPTPAASATFSQPPTPTLRAATPTVRGLGPAQPATPSRTPPPSATARPSLTEGPTATNTRAAGSTAPNFLTTVAKVKGQMEAFGGQIDIAVNNGSKVDCQQIVSLHDSVVAAPKLGVSSSLAGANQLYRQGVDNFTEKTRDMTLNCKNFLADPQPGSIPFQQWGLARQGVAESVDLLRQAIIAAGGTP